MFRIIALVRIVLSVSGLADFDDVSSLRAFGAVFDLELDLVAFVEAAIPVARILNCRKVDEDVLTAVVGDEPVPFCCVEPLDGSVNSVCHSRLLQRKIRRVSSHKTKSAFALAFPEGVMALTVQNLPYRTADIIGISK